MSSNFFPAHISIKSQCKPHKYIYTTYWSEQKKQQDYKSRDLDTRINPCIVDLDECFKIDCLHLVAILRGKIPSVHYAVSLCCVSVTLEDDLKLLKSLPMNQMIAVAAAPRLMTELVPEQLMLLGIRTVHVKTRPD